MPDVHRRIAAGTSKYGLNAKGAGAVPVDLALGEVLTGPIFGIRQDRTPARQRLKENSLLWSADDQT